jgi:hypothetical protein
MMTLAKDIPVNLEMTNGYGCGVTLKAGTRTDDVVRELRSIIDGLVREQALRDKHGLPQ